MPKKSPRHPVGIVKATQRQLKGTSGNLQNSEDAGSPEHKRSLLRPQCKTGFVSGDPMGGSMGGHRGRIPRPPRRYVSTFILNKINNCFRRSRIRNNNNITNNMNKR